MTGRKQYSSQPATYALHSQTNFYQCNCKIIIPQILHIRSSMACEYSLCCPDGTGGDEITSGMIMRNYVHARYKHHPICSDLHRNILVQIMQVSYYICLITNQSRPSRPLINAGIFGTILGYKLRVESVPIILHSV